MMSQFIAFISSSLAVPASGIRLMCHHLTEREKNIKAGAEPFEQRVQMMRCDSRIHERIKVPLHRSVKVGLKQRGNHTAPLSEVSRAEL